MRRVAVWVLFLGLSLTGCATPRGTLGDLDFPDATTALPVEAVFVATSRARSQDPAEFFSRERAAQLNFAHIGVSIPPLHEPGKIERASGRPDPQRHFTTARRGYVDGPARFVARLNTALDREAPRSREVFVFVHGFNNTFAEGLYRAAQIRHDFDLPAAAAIHYSWPSAARASLYAYDRDSANFARDGLVELLGLLSRSKASGIFLVGHSMGALVTMEALRQVRLTGNKRVLSRLSLVALASPDIDVDVFREQMKILQPARPRMVVLVSKDDRALRISERLRGGHPRIGQGKNVDELTAMGIAVFDLSSLDDGDRLNHSTFSSSPSFIEMIRKRQVTRETIRQANTPATDIAGSTASVVGDTASFVLHLPGRIIAPR